MVLQYLYNSFTICSQGACLQYFYNMFTRRVFTIFLQYARKARVYNMFARCVFYNNFHNVHTDTLFPRSYSFLQYTYTGENGDSGLTFISSL